MSSGKVKIFVFSILTAAFLSYSFLLYSVDTGETVQASQQALEGKVLWQQKNCQSCHQLYGLGGHLGPDLTNIYGKRPEASIRSFLSGGTNVMPDFHLSEHEKDLLIQFLKYTNTTGTADPNSFIKNADGTISSK